jgi:hypothetical protein
MLTGFLVSNSAANEWCPHAALASSTAPATATAARLLNIDNIQILHS